jgi:hypothetical protein
LSSLSTADLWIAATFPILATAGRRQWAPALVLGVEESTQALVASAHVSNRRLSQDAFIREESLLDLEENAQPLAIDCSSLDRSLLNVERRR